MRQIKMPAQLELRKRPITFTIFHIDVRGGQFCPVVPKREVIQALS